MKINIRACDSGDCEKILTIVNDGATAYSGLVAEDCVSSPYMSFAELSHEMAGGVKFWGWEEDRALVAVMGIQDVQDVTLIRHAYVATKHQKKGIGGELLSVLRRQTNRPVLIGTWAAATWAVSFYQRHGFRLVSPAQKDLLLSAYWTIPSRQKELSVVLVDERGWLTHAGAILSP